MKPLVQAGRVFIALPPLYKLEKGKGKTKRVEYAWTDEELNKCKENSKGFTLQRYKGLDEMSLNNYGNDDEPRNTNFNSCTS